LLLLTEKGERDSEKEPGGNSFFEWLVKKFYELPASIKC